MKLESELSDNDDCCLASSVVKKLEKGIGIEGEVWPARAIVSDVKIFESSEEAGWAPKKTKSSRTRDNFRPYVFTSSIHTLVCL